MSYFVKAICPRCGMPFTGKEYNPCPHCKAEVNVPFETIYDLKGKKLPERDLLEGMYRFRDFFSLNKGDKEISIGEGDTPLRRLKRLGAHFGLDHLYMKDESKNPTGSHKDRMISLLISCAVAKKVPGIVIASTGNQGIAAAAYSKVAGLPCVVITTPNVSPTMKKMMQVYGAYVFMTPTMDDRRILMEQLIQEKGFEPASGIWNNPPIGSNFRALDAYKTIAYEVYEQMNAVPDWFIVPSSYGDTLYGIYKGMRDLQEMEYIRTLPKMVAAEVFGATKKSIDETGDIPVTVPTTPSIQTSIAVGTTTYQTVKAIRTSKGTAVSSTDEEAIAMQKLLAHTEGVFAEPSSLASLVALSKMVKSGQVKKEDRIVVLITSEGIKDLNTATKGFPEVPVIHPNLDEFYAAMKQTYNTEL